MNAPSLLSLRLGPLLTLALLIGMAPHAQANTGMIIHRTINENNIPSDPFISQGGVAVVPRTFDPLAGTYVIGFWLKGTKNDAFSNVPDPPDRYGALWSTSQNGSTGIRSTGPEASVVPDDDEWHYYVSIIKGNPVPNEGSAYFVYRDGELVYNSNPAYLDVLAIGAIAFVNDDFSIRNKTITPFEGILDDVSIWSTDDPDVMEVHDNIMKYGMSAMPATHPKRLAYYDCSQGNALRYYRDTAHTGTVTDVGPRYDVEEINPVLVAVPDEKPIRFRRVQINSEYGADQVFPTVAESGDFRYEEEQVFRAPKWIYLDRYQRELDPTLPDVVERAFYRAELTGVTAEGIDGPNQIPEGETDIEFSSLIKSDVTITWNWKLQVALFVESATAGVEGLSEPPVVTSIEGQSQSNLQKHWVDVGSTGTVAIQEIITGGVAGAATQFKTTGFVLENQAGSTDRYLALDGEDSSLQGDYQRSVANGGNTTIEYWARRDGRTMGETQELVYLAPYITTAPDMRIGYHPSDHPTNPNGLFIANSPDESGIVAQFSGEGFIDDIWHHWAWVYDEPARTLMVYLDGTLLQVFNDIDLINLNRGNTFAVTLGDNPAGGKPFAGDLNNFRIWDRALDATEVEAARLKQVYGDVPNLRLELSFDAPHEDTLVPEGVAHAPITLNGFDHAKRTYSYATDFTGTEVPSGTALHEAARVDDILTLANLLGSLQGSMVIEDFANEEEVVAMQANFEMRIRDNINNGHGLSFNFAPDLPDSFFGELGTGTGLTVSFDTRPVANQRIRVFYAGSEIGSAQVPSLIDNTWRNVEIILEEDGTLDVSYAGTTYIDNLATGYVPTAGRTGFGARVGTTNKSSHQIDNLDLTYTTRIDGQLDATFPSFRRTERDPDATSGNTFPSGDLVLNDWTRVTWTFTKLHQIIVDNAIGDPAVQGVSFDELPYLIVHDSSGAIVKRLNLGNGETYVPDYSTVTVGTRYRTDDRCYSLINVQGAGGSASNVSMATLKDARDPDGSNAVAREIDLGVNLFGDGIFRITAPGRVTFLYGRTVYKAEIPLGSGFDVSSLEKINEQLVPNLCDGGALDTVNGPGEPYLPENLQIAAPPEMAEWDPVGLQVLPTAPGVFKVEWPDANGNGAHLIEVATNYPKEMAALNWDRENEDGTRQGTFPNYVREVEMAGIGDAFPASPEGHYHYAYSEDGTKTPPVDLDPSLADRWYFLRLTHHTSEDPQALIHQPGSSSFAATDDLKAVLLYKYHPDPTQIATDGPLEALATRIVDTVPLGSVSQDDDVIGSDQRRAASFDGSPEKYIRITAGTGLVSDDQFVSDTVPSSVDFWLRSPEVDPNNVPNPEADRIVFEETAGNGGFLQIGLRGPNHRTSPNRFFVEGLQEIIAEDFNDLATLPDPHLKPVFGNNPNFDGANVAFNGNLGARKYLHTHKSDFFLDDFVAEITVTLAGGGDAGSAFFGLGFGFPNFGDDNKPNLSDEIYMQVQPSDFGGGAVIPVDAGVELAPLAGAAGDGTHRLRLTNDTGAGTLTLEIHQNYTAGDPFVASASQVVDISDNPLGITIGQIFFGGSGGASFDDLLITSRASIELQDTAVDDNWHHWTVVYDPTETPGTLAVYMDGRLMETAEGTFGFEVADITGQLIGKPETGNFNALGDLDNFRVWNGALSTTDIREAMRTKVDILESGLFPRVFINFDQNPSGNVFADIGGVYSVTTPDLADGLDLLSRLADGPPEVATRLRSKLDTAGLGTGWIVNQVANYNGSLYDHEAEGIGNWGPVFPVNWSEIFANDLRIAYYQNPFLSLPGSNSVLHPNVDWPCVAVDYVNVDFPEKGKNKNSRIYIASRLGNEGVDAEGAAQMLYDPAIYSDLSVYHQPSRQAAGFNPNEEHALIEASVATALTGDPALNLGQDAVFALQNDLNDSQKWIITPGFTVSLNTSYTSAPWALVQYFNKDTEEWEMDAYEVEKVRDEDDGLPHYKFEYAFEAGNLVVQPYPVNRVVGNLIMWNDAGDNLTIQRTLWFDKNEIAWVVSGDGQFQYRFWYPFRDDFWYDTDRDGANDIQVGTQFPWVPTNGVFVDDGDGTPAPRNILFNTSWGDNYPKLKRGESATYAGGENKAENPLDEGLPAIVAMASVEVIYDSNTPTMLFSDGRYTPNDVDSNDPNTDDILLYDFSDYSARITRPLDRFEEDFAATDLPESLQATDPDTMVDGPRYYFTELVGSLQKRFYFDALRNKLVFRGRLNNLESGDPDLTATPVALSILEPNVMTLEDYHAIRNLADGNTTWTDRIDALFRKSQNPSSFTPEGNLADPDLDSPVFYAGMQDLAGLLKTVPVGAYTDVQLKDDGFPQYQPLMSLGTGAALVPNPRLLTEDPDRPFYITLVENNHPDVAGAIQLHIIEIVPNRFRGAIKVIEAQDVFDEKINLSHTGDFGGNTQSVYYEWWIRNSGNLALIGTPDNDDSWQLYADGFGLNTIKFAGRPDITLADKLFFVRYGEVNELGDVAGQSNNITNDPDTANVTSESWRLVDINDPFDNWDRSNPDIDFPSNPDTTPDADGAPIPFQWAGASNSPQPQADGSKRYIPQLVMGWVKRVLDRVNPYEARFNDFYNNSSPATYSSMLQIAGKPFIGKVALNSDKNVIENVGLIELYETVLARAKELTLNPLAPAADSGTNQAILLAATRLAVLYELVAREAYSDAQNPTIAVTPENGLATSAPFVHAFMDQEASLLHEELALLRGTDFLKAYPAFNRLFWNYVKGLGEAAYNATYNVNDINDDGFINEFDAATLYPMGHGDAWGHFLSANNMHYELLGTPTNPGSSLFKWEARSELYSLLDNVIEADYLDEQSFARIAAAKARTGLEIVKATYREAYTSDPDGQWQGYTDPADPARAWGVSEWSKRAGQAALFDWFTANAVVPLDADTADPANDEDTPVGPIVENLDQLDRQANIAEISEITGVLASIQLTLDEANIGATPLGLDPDALVFDLDPVQMASGVTHFEQVYERAVQTGQNAVAALEFASKAENQIRRISEDTDALKVEALKQDIDYRNRLIEIFGTPYEGTIGPGQLYAEGYEGPDTLLYLYIDRTDPGQYVPEADSSFTYLTDAVIPAITSNESYTDIDFNSDWGTDDADDFNEIVEQFSLDEDNRPKVTVDDLSFPVEVQHTAKYAFTVPADAGWGQRISTGRIQIVLDQLLTEELALERAINDYQQYVQDTGVVWRRTLMTIEAQDIREQVRSDSGYAIGIASIAEGAAAAVSNGLQWKWDATWQTFVALQEFLPVVNGIDNDFTSSGRGAFLTSGDIASKVLWGLWYASVAVENVSRVTKEVSQALADNDQLQLNEFLEFKDTLAELSLQLTQEEGKRHAIAHHVKRMETLAAELRSTLAEGFRLLDEREGFNKSVAAATQRNRYQDMITRLTRNDALRKYQSAYDNAVRYAWLAAKAYDYETSLDPGDPAAATTILDSIMKERQLGLWTLAGPQIGNGGLAETLAQMKGNFDVLKGQLGINNPQLETGQLSLRHERFRIARDNEQSDARWTKTLQECRVDDLWAIPEFREYCRPFASPADGAQPGIVIELSTEITSGKNFFGRELGGGDHAYSSANFATKLASLGVWFEGYNHTGLATSPRVYLIPVGNDVVRVSNAETPEERTWNVIEQRIPAPYLINDQHLENPGFIPSIDSLDGVFTERNRVGDFRAYHTEGGEAIDPSQMITNSRLIGRSVWNTRWLLIIPGATLHSHANHGLDQFVEGVADIKLQFETYTHEGN